MSTVKQANQYYKSGNTDKVIEICKNILAKKVDFNALRLMALALNKKNFLRDSIAMFDMAERLNPNHVDVKLDKIDAMMKFAESADHSMLIKAVLALRKLTKLLLYSTAKSIPTGAVQSNALDF